MVDPRVGVADADSQFLQLLDRITARVGRQPGVVVQPVAELSLHPPDQVLHGPLRLGGEDPRHVQLGDWVSELRLEVLGYDLGARRLVHFAVHQLPERQGRVEVCRREIGRRVLQQFPPEVGLRVSQRDIRQHGVALPEGVHLDDDRLGLRREADGLQVGIHVDVGQELAQLGERHPLVLLVGIPAVHRRQLLACDARLQLEDLRGHRVGFPRGDSGQGEVGGDPLHVAGPKRGGVGLQVEVVAHRQLAVHRVDRVLGTVLRVRADGQRNDDRLVVDQHHVRQLLGDRLRRGQGRDAVEFRLERPHTEVRQVLLVHAGGIEVADLLQRRPLGGCAARLGRALEDLRQLRLGPLAEEAHGEDPDAVARNPRSVEPLARGVAIEVLRRGRRGVHLRGREPDRKPEADILGDGRARRGTAGGCCRRTGLVLARCAGGAGRGTGRGQDEDERDEPIAHRRRTHRLGPSPVGGATARRHVA